MNEVLAIVAALDREIAPLRRRLDEPRDRRRLGRGGVAVTGLLGGKEIVIASLGDGPRRAVEGFERLAEGTPLRGVLVVGFSGGLTPDLAAGDLVVGETIRDARGDTPRPDRGLRAALPEASRGQIYSSERIVGRGDAKRELARALGSSRRAAVDLESAALARAAAARGIPFTVVRAVSDAADEDLPLDFEACRDASGGVRLRSIVARALLRPACVPGLLRLGVVARRCAGALANAAEGWARAV